MRRRRFLQVACAAALARPAEASTWRGVALGAHVEITTLGRDLPPEQIVARLRAIEAAFSLYDVGSEISRINAGERPSLSPLFQRLLEEINAAHQVTEGLFDPTVQALYAARAAGQAPPYDAVGWQWPLKADQQVTFNGIAQGFAADDLRGLLRQAGIQEALVNVGEFAALGGPWRLEIQDPALALPVGLSNRARATSTAAPHLFHPNGGSAKWSTVSVEADTATMADALSTALLFADRPQMQRILRRAKASALVIDFDANAFTLQ